MTYFTSWAALACASALLLFACGNKDEEDDDASTRGSAAGGQGGDAQGGSAGEGGAGGDAGLCESLCATKDSLMCPTPQPDCLGVCEENRGYAPWCQSQTDGYLSCLASDPANYECDLDGLPAPASGNPCESGQASMFDCFAEGPLPDFTETCTEWCAVLEQVSACPPPSDCVDQCLGFVDDALPCNSATAMLILCESKLTPADFECGGEPAQPFSSSGFCSFQKTFSLNCP